MPTVAKDCGLGAVCVCFFNMWNEETMGERLCVFGHVYAYVPAWGGFFAATLLCEGLSLYRPAVSGGVCGPPVRSQQTPKAK